MEYLVFLGDIKGTKSALESFSTGGEEILERRMDHLQNVFAQLFLKFCKRTRSLKCVTFSDSVVAYWTDSVEGKRIAVEYMSYLWLNIDKSLVNFRGFLDLGPGIKETSPIAYALDNFGERYIRTIPTGLAVWSVAVAEASHFPDGIYVSCQVANALNTAKFEKDVFSAGHFDFLKMDFT